MEKTPVSRKIRIWRAKKTKFKTENSHLKNLTLLRIVKGAFWAFENPI